MAENQVQSEKKMTSLNVSSETRDAIKDISTSLGLSQADTVAHLVDGYHPNATPGVKAALDASAVLDEAVERVKRIIVGAAEAAAMEARAAREDADAVTAMYHAACDMLAGCCPGAAAVLEEAEPDALAYLDFPPTHWKRQRRLRAGESRPRRSGGRRERPGVRCGKTEGRGRGGSPRCRTSDTVPVRVRARAGAVRCSNGTDRTE